MSNDKIRIKLEGVDIDFSLTINEEAHEKLLQVINLTFPGSTVKTRLVPGVTKEIEPDAYIFSTKSIEGKTLKDVSRPKLEKVFREKPQVFTEADRDFLTKLIKGE